MNSLVTSSWVVNESGERFMNSVKGIPNFNRSLDDQFKAHDGSNVGYTVQYRLPNRYVVRRGQAAVPQAMLDLTTPVTLSYQDGVDFDWSSAQATQELQRVRERYINPAADAIASDADMQAMLDVYPAVWNAVGTPGTTPATSQLYTDAVVKILDGAGGTVDVKAVLDVLAASRIANAQSTLFHPGSTISAANRTGRLQDMYLGISEWFQDQNVPSHTTGSFTSCTPLVNGASQTGSSLITDGWASGATVLEVGDKFTLNGVYSVNPITRQSTTRLQDFTVTARGTDTTGDMTISIAPSIITSGALQTVTASPANNAPINVWSGSGTYALTATPSKQSLVFAPDAFAFVMADLVDPVAGAKATFARSKDFGISIRFCQQWQGPTDQNLSRLDCLFGAAPLQARLACRVAG
jgi:coat protein Gp5